MTKSVPFEATLRIRDTCLCLHVQRTARTLARHFDEALRPVGLTNGQFSLLMALNRPQPAGMGELASLMGADRTTLTAALKPLDRRGLIVISEDAQDRRSRRVALTGEGRVALATAVPIWERAQAVLETRVGGDAADRLRRDLAVLSGL
jgi:DNA-binding MarR family transcriptional regulator